MRRQPPMGAFIPPMGAFIPPMGAFIPLMGGFILGAVASSHVVRCSDSASTGSR